MCVIPTTGFYEWGPDKTGKKRKYRFNFPGEEKALYLAGIWNEFAGERKYVILTTEANASMEGIHDRMPVMLARDDAEKWVRVENNVCDFPRVSLIYELSAH